MDEVRLEDGACICDVLVQATPETIVAAFGRPVKLAESGRTLTDDSLARDIVFFAAGLEGLSWSVIEAVSNEAEPLDYIVTMLRQTNAALAGDVLALPLSYENGLGVAQLVARQLRVPALAVWGSDEWVGLCGGALFDASGNIVRACNVCGPDAIALHLAARERLASDDYDPDDDETSDDDGDLVLYEPATGLRTVAGEVIPFLDAWFKELGAAQPTSPPSLWGVWEGYAEVWGAAST